MNLHILLREITREMARKKANEIKMAQMQTPASTLVIDKENHSPNCVGAFPDVDEWLDEKDTVAMLESRMSVMFDD
jgi:hypothetical protein